MLIQILQKKKKNYQFEEIKAQISLLCLITQKSTFLLVEIKLSIPF